MPPVGSLVFELQRAVLDPQLGIAHLMRVARMAAIKLEVSEMLSWIERETAGYADADEIPEYRRVTGVFQFFDRYRGEWFNAEAKDLAGQALLDKAGEIWLHYSISEIEALAAGGELSRVQWDGKPAQAFRAAMGGRPVSLLVLSAQFLRVIERVRDAIADWSLKLERMGIVGEGLSVSQEEKQKAAETGGTVFQTNFYGGDFSKAQIQQGTHGSTQKSGIDPQELLSLGKALSSALVELNLSQEDRGALDNARGVMETEAAATKPDKGAIRSALEKLSALAGGVLASYIANKYQIQIDQLLSMVTTGRLP